MGDDEQAGVAIRETAGAVRWAMPPGDPTVPPRDGTGSKVTTASIDSGS